MSRVNHPRVLTVHVSLRALCVWRGGGGGRGGFYRVRVGIVSVPSWFSFERRLVVHGCLGDVQ